METDKKEVPRSVSVHFESMTEIPSSKAKCLYVKEVKMNIPGGVRSCSVVLSISSLSITRPANSSSNDNLQISQSMDS